MKSDPKAKLRQWQLAVLMPLSDFWHWWTTELSLLVPERWRKRWTGRVRVLSYVGGYFEWREGAQVYRVAIEQSAHDPTLATWRTLDNAKADLVVTLGEKELLHKTVSFPAAVEPRLESVLGFELDRHTPFSADQASFSYRIIKRDRANQKIELDLFVLPNSLRDKLTQALSRAGLRPSAIVPQVAEQDSNILGTLNLLPESQRYKASRAGVLRSRPVWVALLISVAIGALFYQREARLLELQELIAPRQAVAEQAMAVRKEIEMLESGGLYIYKRKTSRPAALILLNDLTDLLPDDTWISRLELEGSEIRLQGESESASGLIALLEGASLFEQVGFTSPVTINPRTQKERFSLKAQVVEEGAP